MATDPRVQSFAPINDLERALLAAHSGEGSAPDLMRRLAEGHVAMLVDQEFTETEHPEGLRPLVLQGARATRPWRMARP
ncbi:hypothetical protein [Aquisalimonas sp.]|uniref:hypothetical protein n=1 Tax=Aquisalimonas sp. TaxID=1872621 RepID=UPI0025C40CEF|nr:hypothetical protein [Aquisalimonas sp.]